MTKITVQNDICLIMIIPMTAPHHFIPLPPFPPVPPPMPATPLSLQAAAIEIPVPAWWPPGFALGDNKFTTTVFHKNMTICQDGHDCGKFIIHVQATPGPNNMLTLVHIPMSKRKANFSASTVKMNGKPTACMTMIAWPPTPMTYCSDPINWFTASAPTSHLNSVSVGMTLGDWLAGAFAILVGVLLDLLFNKMSGGTKGFGQSAGKMIAQSRAGKYVYQILASKFVGSIKQNMVEWGIKQAAAVLTGAVKVGATGEGTIGLAYEIGGPFFSLKGEAGVKFTDGKGKLATGVSGKAATLSGSVDNDGWKIANNHPLGLGSEEIGAKWGEGATTTTTETDPGLQFANETVTTKPDGTTSVGTTADPVPMGNSL